MNEVLFKERRQGDWIRLADLATKMDNNPTTLTADEFFEITRLHRRVARDLAILRTWSTRTELVADLNNLLSRVHCQLYDTPRGRFVDGLRSFLYTTAQTFRRNFRFVFASFSLFWVGLFFAYFAMTFFPATRTDLVPPSFEGAFDSWKKGELPNRSTSDRFDAWQMYAINNPLVAARTSAVGAASFGLLTVQSLFQNGAILGTLAYECESTGRLSFLVVNILPHGVSEIGGVFVSGSAGLVLGWALICPGRRRRSEALLDAGKDALYLMFAGIVMMYIAAPIEGFFSFDPLIPPVAKLMFALLSVTLWTLFWTQCGLSDEEKASRSRTRLLQESTSGSSQQSSSPAR